ncbi:MAG: hypothetical protein LN413_00485 [Candidatus Thermoplasmatota archaeon]|nr:hypothetical protein [Candidatus Thermoplasmatota archaeon]
MSGTEILFGWCERGDCDDCPGDSTLVKEGKGTTGPPDFEPFYCSCSHHKNQPELVEA